jgi:multicomponent Na+:H+ antiporter subunit B
VIALVAALGLLIAGGLVALARARNLYTVMIALSVYSALLAATFAVLEAVDVSFTEAVVGSSVSTILIMLLLRRVDPFVLGRPGAAGSTVGIIAAFGVSALLLRGILALAPFGDPLAPPHIHVAPYYIANSMIDMNTPNTVTTVLAGYRGFDTLIETAVVLTAALACMLILGVRDTKGPHGGNTSETANESASGITP